VFWHVLVKLGEDLGISFNKEQLEVMHRRLRKPRGLHLEFGHPVHHLVITSRIADIREFVREPLPWNSGQVSSMLPVLMK
jgi:hypothetical protein